MDYTTTFGVGGMAGDHCVRIVTAELLRLHGVVDVVVDLATHTVQLTSSSALDRAAIAEAIDDAGYTFVG